MHSPPVGLLIPYWGTSAGEETVPLSSMTSAETLGMYSPARTFFPFKAAVYVYFEHTHFLVHSGPIVMARERIFVLCV